MRLRREGKAGRRCRMGCPDPKRARYARSERRRRPHHVVGPQTPQRIVVLHAVAILQIDGLEPGGEALEIQPRIVSCHHRATRLPLATCANPVDERLRRAVERRARIAHRQCRQGKRGGCAVADLPERMNIRKGGSSSSATVGTARHGSIPARRSTPAGPDSDAGPRAGTRIQPAAWRQEFGRGTSAARSHSPPAGRPSHPDPAAQALPQSRAQGCRRRKGQRRPAAECRSSPIGVRGRGRARWSQRLAAP